jgi:predicted glycogen debranching enzyme
VVGYQWDWGLCCWHCRLLLTLKALINYRDYHGDTHSNGWEMKVESFERGICVTAAANAKPLYLASDCARATPAHNWCYNFDLAIERERGLTDREDHLHAATFEITLNPGESLTFVASTAPQPNLDGLAALKSYCARSRKLLDLWKLNRTETFTRKQNCPAWIDLLVLAADRFIVDRSVPEVPNGKTIIAGYHWFGDWGRDTMISLPGLTIATGRFGKANATRTEIARSILLTFAKYVDCGTSPESGKRCG